MPEKFIWRTAVAVHCLPRIVLFASVIHKYYKNTEIGKRYTSTTWWFGLLNLLNCILQVVENGGLITLSYVSSTDNLGKIFSNSILVTRNVIFTKSSSSLSWMVTKRCILFILLYCILFYYFLKFFSAVHEGSFIIFTLCAMLYMLLSCILFWLTANKPMNVQVQSKLVNKM